MWPFTDRKKREEDRRRRDSEDYAPHSPVHIPVHVPDAPSAPHCPPDTGGSHSDTGGSCDALL